MARVTLTEVGLADIEPGMEIRYLQKEGDFSMLIMGIVETATPYDTELEVIFTNGFGMSLWEGDDISVVTRT